MLIAFYGLLLLTIASVMAARGRPGVFARLAFIAFAAAVACGGAHLLSRRKAPPRFLAMRFNVATGFVLGRALQADLHAGDEIVVVHWNSPEGRELMAGVQSAFSGTSVRVISAVPPAVTAPATPTGGPPALASEFRGVPPGALYAIGQLHPQAKAFFLFVEFRPLLTAGAAAALPAPLVLDEQASNSTTLPPLLASGKIRAAAVRKKQENWRARDAVHASPEEAFAMQYDLVRPSS